MLRRKIQEKPLARVAQGWTAKLFLTSNDIRTKRNMPACTLPPPPPAPILSPNRWCRVILLKIVASHCPNPEKPRFSKLKLSINLNSGQQPISRFRDYPHPDVHTIRNHFPRLNQSITVGKRVPR